MQNDISMLYDKNIEEYIKHFWLVMKVDYIWGSLLIATIQLLILGQSKEPELVIEPIATAKPVRYIDSILAPIPVVYYQVMPRLLTYQHD